LASSAYALTEAIVKYLADIWLLLCQTLFLELGHFPSSKHQGCHIIAGLKGFQVLLNREDLGALFVLFIRQR